MLNIQSGISKNQASFGNGQTRVIVMRPQDYEYYNEFRPMEVEDVDYEDVTDKFENNAKVTNPHEYTREDYDADKSFLEKSKKDVEEMIGNVDTPKPLKVLGKIVLGGISVAMGFMSMKWGTLASWKVAENIATNPKVQKVANNIAKPIKSAFETVADTVKEHKVGETISETVSEKAGKINKAFADTKFGKKVNEFAENLKNNKFYGKGKEVIEKVWSPVKNFFVGIKEKFSGLTTEKVKNFFANLFGVSGGVTAGVETVQAESAKNNK